ncbi:hypothetical protein Cgig2_031618 [Carnegiea gigantea]|uniref:Uncharacterized protein n=1 Tax=Carnegiea gigantea TaxID=171969 RepID=A0A9Q1K0V6_9CARY|nr:hypothetical protein Cgig2_031618 [Carnegiea gigantea]
MVGGDPRRGSGGHLVVSALELCGLKLIPPFVGYQSLKFRRLLASGGMDSSQSLNLESVQEFGTNPSPVSLFRVLTHLERTSFEFRISSHCPSNQMVTSELNLLIMAISDLILFNHQNILLLIMMRTFVGMNKQVKTTPVISSHMLQKAALSCAQVDILVDTVLRNHPKEVHQYRSSKKKKLIVFYLAGVVQIAMGICKCKAEPSMLDMVLREKLDEIILVTTKGNVQ